MAVFEQAILDQIASGVVRRAALVQLEFRTQTMRVWQGFGSLVAGGETWDGLGKLNSISAITAAPGGAAGQLTIELSGVDSGLQMLAMNEVDDEARGRFITVLVQYFDAAWQPLGAPKARWLGTMDTLKISSQNTDDGGRIRTITLTAESWAADRSSPAFGSYSDRDQQARFAGDRGCERVTELQNKVSIWPLSY
jgi:hypothetical protein